MFFFKSTTFWHTLDGLQPIIIEENFFGEEEQYKKVQEEEEILARSHILIHLADALG